MTNPYAPPGESAADLLNERVTLDTGVVTAIFFGMLVILYCVTLRSLWHASFRSKGREIRRTWFFIAYITVLFIFGFLYFVAETWGTEAAFVDFRNYPGGPLGWEEVSDGYPLIYMGNVVYFIADWMADGLLLWRCFIIWRGSRLGLVLIIPTAMLYLCNIALSIVLLNAVNSPTSLSPSFDISTTYFVVSLVVTMTISALIVLRIMMQRKWIMSSSDGMGGFTRQYISIASMIIESAALYSACSLAFLVPFLTESPLATLFLPLLSQAQIAGPLLIIYRVSRGQSWDTQSSPPAVFSTDIQFASRSMTAGVNEANEAGNSQVKVNTEKMGTNSESTLRW